MGDPMWFYIEFFHVMGFYIIYGFQPNFNKTAMQKVFTSSHGRFVRFHIYSFSEQSSIDPLLAILLFFWMIHAFF